MTDENGGRLYTTGDVAEMLNLNRVTIWLRAKRAGAGRKAGRMMVFTEKDVEAIRNAPDGRRKKKIDQCDSTSTMP